MRLRIFTEPQQGASYDTQPADTPSPTAWVLLDEPTKLTATRQAAQAIATTDRTARTYLRKVADAAAVCT
jgi:hypothetical protein